MSFLKCKLHQSNHSVRFMVSDMFETAVSHLRVWTGKYRGPKETKNMSLMWPLPGGNLQWIAGISSRKPLDVLYIYIHTLSISSIYIYMYIYIYVIHKCPGTNFALKIKTIAFQRWANPSAPVVPSSRKAGNRNGPSASTGDEQQEIAWHFLGWHHEISVLFEGYHNNYDIYISYIYIYTYTSLYINYITYIYITMVVVSLH